MMRYIYIIAMVALASCMKEEAYDTLIIFTPEECLGDDQEYQPLDGVVTYAFAADTTDYSVVNYDTALRGVAVNKVSGEELLPIAEGMAYGDDGVYRVSMQVAMEDVMLVAIDTKNGNYAYSNYSVGINLGVTYIALPFLPYKSDYVVGKWQYVVENQIEELTNEEEEEEEETADETTDETVDETTDETTDETVDETEDETVDETEDETVEE